MLKIDAGDVLRFAIRIEEDGELFYNRAALVVDDKNVSDLFNELAAEEIRHKTIFEGLLSGVRHIDPPESYPGEYAAYLHDYIDGKVIFLKEKKAEAAEIHTVASALDFAIQREADSILYYQELKGYVVQKEQPAIDKIIDEERSHFVRLSAMKKNYA
jgi:rubrerythrin